MFIFCRKQRIFFPRRRDSVIFIGLPASDLCFDWSVCRDRWNIFVELDGENPFYVEDDDAFNVCSPKTLRTTWYLISWTIHCQICKIVSPPYTLYMGEEKHENEELIKWGFPEDVWFHVDKVSSAHVYLRLHPNETLDDVPQAVIDDCAQLVKANSIQGNKMNNIEVVYTMWSNLKKTGGMDVGQVGFHKDREVRKVKVERRMNEIVNRLNKTKEDKKPDLRAEREERDRKERDDQKRMLLEQRKKEKEEQDKKKADAEQRSYANLMRPENMTSNQDDGNDSDDFM